jgi:hypothetical protein
MAFTAISGGDPGNAMPIARTPQRILPIEDPGRAWELRISQAFV